MKICICTQNESLSHSVTYSNNHVYVLCVLKILCDTSRLCETQKFRFDLSRHHCDFLSQSVNVGHRNFDCFIPTETSVFVFVNGNMFRIYLRLMDNAIDYLKPL